MTNWGLGFGIHKQIEKLVFAEMFWKSWNYSVGEPFMAPVTQYVFAEMLI